jgi:hypothetical protein
MKTGCGEQESCKDCEGLKSLRDDYEALTLVVAELARRLSMKDEKECDDDGDDEDEDEYVQMPIDGEPWTFEGVDPKSFDTLELLGNMSRFPFDLSDKEEPSGPEPEGEEGDEEEEFEIDLLGCLMIQDETRSLWKDFDPTYR